MQFKIIKLSKTNCYLFKTNNGFMLTDCGYDFDQNLMDRKLKKYNLSYESIKWLFLTHHHDDHVGLINYFVSRNPDIRIIMHKSCSELLNQGVNQRYPGGGWVSRRSKFVCETYSKLYKNWSLSFPPYSIRTKDYLVNYEDDNILRKLGLKAKILFTPGHTADSISILDDQGNIFCGDAAANYLKWTGTNYSPVYISEIFEYYQSWDKIIHSGAVTIYPAHGKSFSINKISQHQYRIKKLSKFVWND